MNGFVQPWRKRVVAYCRVVGAMLALAVAGVAVAAALLALRQVDQMRARGHLDAQRAIVKIRTCHRAPPHPTWTECERLVEDRE
jgi:hypothetical protein